MRQLKASEKFNKHIGLSWSNRGRPLVGVFRHVSSLSSTPVVCKFKPILWGPTSIVGIRRQRTRYLNSVIPDDNSGSSGTLGTLNTFRSVSSTDIQPLGKTLVFDSVRRNACVVLYIAYQLILLVSSGALLGLMIIHYHSLCNGFVIADRNTANKTEIANKLYLTL